MKVDELKQYPLYGLLTPPQKLFVELYLTTSGNISLAITRAFPNVRAVGQYSVRLQKNPNIAAILALIDGEEKPSKEALSKLLWKTIRNSSKERIIIEGSKQLTELEGYTLPETEEEKRDRIKRQMKEIDQWRNR